MRLASQFNGARESEKTPAFAPSRASGLRRGMRKRGFHRPLASLLRQALRLAQGHEREAEWLRTHASLETQSALRKHKGHCQDLPRFHKMADTSEPFDVTHGPE